MACTGARGADGAWNGTDRLRGPLWRGAFGRGAHARRVTCGSVLLPASIACMHEARARRTSDARGARRACTQCCAVRGEHVRSAARPAYSGTARAHGAATSNTTRRDVVVETAVVDRGEMQAWLCGAGGVSEDVRKKAQGRQGRRGESGESWYRRTSRVLLRVRAGIARVLDSAVEL